MGGNDWGSFFIVAGLCGLIGWGFIELLIWLFSFVHISFGG